jgi:hypothetical protein
MVDARHSQIGVDCFVLHVSSGGFAHDLAPRAYIITPILWNAVTLTYSFSDGGILFNNILPVKGVHATLNVPIASYFHSMRFSGRTANFPASLLSR